MNARKLTLPLVSLGLVLGFAVGAGAFSRTSPSGKSKDSETKNEPGTSRPASETSDARFATDDAAIGAVFSAWQRKNPLRRAAELKAAIDGLDSSQLAQMVERVAGFADWEMQQLLRSLVKQWALKDPAAAAAWARPAIERCYASAAKNSDWLVNSAWCMADPEGAIALAMERSDATASQQMISMAISALAENDPAAQLDRMAALPPGRLREAAIATALTEWAKEDPAAALARLDDLPAGARRDETLTNVLQGWAGKEPAAALAEASRRLESGELGRGRGYLGRTISAAAGADPAGTMRWAENLPDDLRADARVLAAAGWASKDPLAALDWARANGVSPDQRSFLDGQYWGDQNILNAALNSDPKKTVEWLRAQPDSAERGRLLGQSLYRLDKEIAFDVFRDLPPDAQKYASWTIGYKLGEMGQDEAVAWARKEVSGPARENVIAGLVGTLGRNSSETIDSVLKEFPSGADRDAALRGAVESMWAKPADGLPYAQRISDPVIRERTFRSLASGWLYRDGPAARAWLAGTTELAPDVKAMLMREVTDN
ncbi:MAG: hypothetical protein ABI680_00900 [Chthoniobacteraceae bacterium]